MGLLSKAASASKNTLDEMGIALAERINRLPGNPTAQDTALNLLKTYAAFRAGALLSLDDSRYTSYSILGFGRDTLHIPLKALREHHEDYYRLPGNEIIELKDAGSEGIYWVFALTDGNPPEAILAVSVNPDFNPDTVQLILEKTCRVFLPGGKKQADRAAVDPEQNIRDYFERTGPFYCCIYNTGGDDTIPDNILLSVKSFGQVFPLRQNTFILLFPSSIDHSLLLHHLNQRFELNTVDQFFADSAEKALVLIQNYL